MPRSARIDFPGLLQQVKNVDAPTMYFVINAVLVLLTALSAMLAVVQLNLMLFGCAFMLHYVRHPKNSN